MSWIFERFVWHSIMKWKMSSRAELCTWCVVASLKCFSITKCRDQHCTMDDHWCLIVRVQSCLYCLYYYTHIYIYIYILHTHTCVLYEFNVCVCVRVSQAKIRRSIPHVHQPMTPHWTKVIGPTGYRPDLVSSWFVKLPFTGHPANPHGDIKNSVHQRDMKRIKIHCDILWPESDVDSLPYCLLWSFLCGKAFQCQRRDQSRCLKIASETEIASLAWRLLHLAFPQ